MSEFIVTIGQKKRILKFADSNHIDIDGSEHSVTFSKISDYLYLLKIDDKVYEITTTKINSENYQFSIDGRFISATVRTLLQERANEVLKQREALSKHASIKAPMPGLILRITKQEGDKVELGEPLIVLEAMKMENEIRSPASGIITEIGFKEGDSVEKDAIILNIE